MHFGSRGPRSSVKQARKSETFRPRGEELEAKVLLALLQLGAGTPFNLAGQVTTAPAGPQTIGGQLPFIADSFGFQPQTQGTQTTDPGLGVLQTGNVANQGAGYSVAAVGDMNLGGSNDFVIGAPTATYAGSTIVAGTGNTDTAYLIFGNRSVNLPTTQSWLSATPEQRVGLLSDIGGNLQVNPFTNRNEPYSYAFDGVSFITSQHPNSGLGQFVAAAGSNAFVIGAPNWGGTGVGRLYYITATSNFNALSLRTGPIDLDNPQNYPGLTIVTFTDTGNTGLGTSFADVPNLFGDGVDDLAIGEPSASVAGGIATGAGGVFIFPINSLPFTPGVPNLVSVSSAPFRFAGANSGDMAGFSVANAGDVNNATSALGATNDLLIGAPGFNKNAGAAYLVYGGTPLTSGALGGLVDLSQLSVVPTVITGQAPAQGAVFVGAGTDQAGYTVSGAGNFNAAVDSFGDFMIGSPGGNGGAGRREPVLRGVHRNLHADRSRRGTQCRPGHDGREPDLAQQSDRGRCQPQHRDDLRTDQHLVRRCRRRFPGRHLDLVCQCTDHGCHFLQHDHHRRALRHNTSWAGKRVRAAGPHERHLSASTDDPE